MSEEPDIVLLGECNVPEAQRMLDALEQAEIPFDAQTHNQPGQNGYRGSFGRTSRVQIWVRQVDLIAAQDILKKVLKIEV